MYFYHDTHSRCEESLYPVLLSSFVLRSSWRGLKPLCTSYDIGHVYIIIVEINRAKSLLAENFISRWKFHRTRLKVILPRKNNKTPLTQSLAILLVSLCCLRHIRTVVYDVMRQSRSCDVSCYRKSQKKILGLVDETVRTGRRSNLTAETCTGKCAVNKQRSPYSTITI